MATRRELIVEKYNALCTELELLTPDPFLPSLDEVDVADLIYFITITFLGCADDLACQLRLREILDIHRIQLSNETFALMYPLVKEFLEFVKIL